MSGFREIVEGQPAQASRVEGEVPRSVSPRVEAEPVLIRPAVTPSPVPPLVALTMPAAPVLLMVSERATALVEVDTPTAVRTVLRALPPGNGRTLPAGLSLRTFAVLRLVGLAGPTVFAELERLTPALVDGLAGKRSLHRLLYRELERLQKGKFVLTRRLPLASCGIYAVSVAGAALLRAHDAADVSADALERFLAFPEHEAGLRRIRAELLLARFSVRGAGEGRLRSLAFDDRWRFSLDGAHAYEPDAFYELGLGDGGRQVLIVEFDRTTKPIANWREKITKAAVAMASLDPSTRLLVVALAPRRLGTLLEVAAEVLGPGRERLRGIVLDEFTAEALWEPVFVGPEGRQGEQLWRP